MCNTALYDVITSCRLCKSSDFKTVLDFGENALANSYPDNKTATEKKIPLTVVKCGVCKHIQLKETVNPDFLFTNYLYSSSDSPSLHKHFLNYATALQEKIENLVNLKILEIGCNDGILLNALKQKGVKYLIGVDPAKNIIERAKHLQNVHLISDFFNIVTSKNIIEKHGKIDVICANNVFAHVKELDEMTQGVVNCLSEDGVFVFENAYLYDTIKNLYFDQVYHEHLQYYGILPVQSYLKQHGLEIFDIQHVSTQGGSFRIFSKKISNKKLKIKDTVYEFINKELSENLYDDKTYILFNDKLSTLKQQMNKFVNDVIQENKTISCYGCPAKFALFSNFFNLNANNIQYVVDDSPLKQGRFSPGSKIPIVSKEHFIKNPTDYCIVSVWNMADSIIKSNPQYRGKFVIPMPKLCFV